MTKFDHRYRNVVNFSAEYPHIVEPYPAGHLGCPSPALGRTELLNELIHTEHKMLGTCANNE